MTVEQFVGQDRERLGARLTGIYARTAAWYLLAVFVLWAVGVEGIYGSPMPFYALWYPAFSSWMDLRWHGLVWAVFLVGFIGLLAAMRRLNWFEQEPSRRVAAWFVVATVAFAFAFAGAVAMIRNGPEGIAQAYQRHGYEYISDIGTTGTIQALFRDYLKVRPYLSMHAKVHPPGPIALLWIMSYIVGQEPMALSLATMAVGALGLIPLYLWAADLAGRRVALTCCVLYSLMPSIVLFTATSADILFPPFVLTTLYLFWRALHRRSMVYALAAGIGYAVLSLLSFSLLALGAFFAFVALWRLREGRWRWPVVQTALVMVVGFAAVHILVRWWSGFDYVACYHACKAQFDLDQVNLDQVTPRYPAWVWKIANPACWFFFAGIPVSVLFVMRLARSEPPAKGLFVVCALTLAVLTLLYLARGEGERSALYVMPFVALPAAHLVDQLGRLTRSFAPLTATVAFLGIQCWLTESLLYTFW